VLLPLSLGWLLGRLKLPVVLSLGGLLQLLKLSLVLSLGGLLHMLLRVLGRLRNLVPRRRRGRGTQLELGILRHGLCT
jgi:hypothetical protein